MNTEKVKLLIVDDLEENLLALKALLKFEEAEIFTAKGGTEALELLLRYDFSLAILDVQMPGMDGFELGELMRGNERTKNIPIIFVTASARDQGKVFAGYENGAVDFMYKPLDAHIVRSKVKVFLELGLQRKILEQQRNHFRELNTLKTNFIANVSHEIRTPLNAILGFSELMTDPSATAEQRNSYYKTICANGQALLHLIDDILDLSRVEAGKLRIENKRFSIRQFLSELESTFSSVAQDKNLVLKFECDPIVPDAVSTDNSRVRQILVNIIGNAIKFTAQGSVQLRTSFVKKEGLPHLEFMVSDTGPGIPAEYVDRLFQPFSQADSSVTRRYGGTGLGLNLSLRLAKALGGDIKIHDTQINKGTTFCVSVPVSIVREETSQQTEVKVESEAKDLKGKKVLLVEDAQDSRLLGQKILSKLGVDVECATNGREAIDKALGARYDLIFMDIQMPEVDGYEATRTLRKRGYAAPIVALTAHAMNDERERCLSAGCTDHISKPISTVKLRDALQANLI